MGVFSKTIILLALIGYEIIVANSWLRAWLATTISSHTRTRGIIVTSPVYPCISSTIVYPVILCNLPAILHFIMEFNLINYTNSFHFIFNHTETQTTMYDQPSLLVSR